MQRRNFLASLAALSPQTIPAPATLVAGSNLYRDPHSGLEIRELTGPSRAASNLYFHFSNFTAGNRYLLFAADSPSGRQIWRADSTTWEIAQLTSTPGIAAASACPHLTNPALLYYTLGPQVRELNHLTGRDRLVGEVPKPIIGGLQQPTLSGDCRFLALTRQRDERNWEIGLMEVATGAYRSVITQGFRIGHVQHHPSDPVIFYVWETGGYAPQRTWLVDADGSANRPFYARTDRTQWFTPLKEWVTHEAWIRETGDMTLILDKTGILIAGKTGNAELIPGDYWHCAATPDGRRLVADDFDGRLWLLEVKTGNRRLLASGLRAAVRAVHPHASFCRAGRWIVTNTGRRHPTVAIIDTNS
jgi:hypothetical protein